MEEEVALFRVKRDWVPEWLWRALSYSSLPEWWPFRQILTRKPTPEEME